MVKQGRGGRIIGASSLCGKLGQSIATYHNLLTCLTAVDLSGTPGTAAYSASKFAVRGLTQSAGK
jgi:NAD(P)-dependent dehydrogenase (short-subunit alcohol dehydrogenase family)